MCCGAVASALFWYSSDTSTCQVTVSVHRLPQTITWQTVRHPWKYNR